MGDALRHGTQRINRERCASFGGTSYKLLFLVNVWVPTETVGTRSTPLLAATDASAQDKLHIAAMAAKGYWEAYQQVKRHIKNALVEKWADNPRNLRNRVESMVYS